MKLIFLIISILVFSGYGCENKKYSELEQSRILQGIILARTIGAGTAVSCSSSVPFSSVVSAGLTSKCAGCHSGANLRGGVDVSSASALSSRIISGNPEGSSLYKAVTSGSMATYSDSTLNSAIYCWIKAGAAP